MRIDDQVGALLAHNFRPSQAAPKVASGDEKAVSPDSQAATPPVPARQQQTTAAARAEDADKNGPKSNYEKIVEVGFSQFVADIEAEKLKELREKILQAMGLNEESLAKMPAEQRGQIEKMIAEEIARRIQGGAVMNGAPNEDKIAPGQEASGANEARPSAAMGKRVDGGTSTKSTDITQGLGPLLALQEIQENETKTAHADGLDKFGKKGPYGL